MEGRKSGGGGPNGRSIIHQSSSSSSSLCPPPPPPARNTRQQGVFAEDVARLYAAEIVLALSYLHAAGIVHRDLKVCARCAARGFGGFGAGACVGGWVGVEWGVSFSLSRSRALSNTTPPNPPTHTLHTHPLSTARERAARRGRPRAPDRLWARQGQHGRRGLPVRWLVAGTLLLLLLLPCAVAAAAAGLLLGAAAWRAHRRRFFSRDFGRKKKNTQQRQRTQPPPHNTRHNAQRTNQQRAAPTALSAPWSTWRQRS